jgi:DMSO/TMAO reductase YedYZ molybdopterin-dependent catalytic subunit
MFGNRFRRDPPQSLPEAGDLPRVISPDTLRPQRLPPGQSRARRWPVLTWGEVPQVDLATWELRVGGLVEQELRLSWEDFRRLPRIEVLADMHCVTTWSLLDNLWEGVGVQELMKRARPLPEAGFVLVSCYGGYTTNLPLEDFLQPDVLLADRRQGEPLPPEHGGPVRLVVPRLYAWKSAKWIQSIELLRQDIPGFWERNGYHPRGDPWAEERFG